MIVVDSRKGSGELAPLFPNTLNVSVGMLDYGDFFFLGNGEEETVVTIGIERKEIHDLVNSMVTGRLSGHQLPGLLDKYNHVYLVVEGVWRSDFLTGLAQVLTGRMWTNLCLGERRFMGKEIFNFLNTLQVKAGVKVIQTGSREETVQAITALYHWWNDKQWEDHTSHLLPNKSGKGSHGEIRLVKPPLARRIAAELPLIGWKKSARVVNHFGSVYNLTHATVKEWADIDGIGNTIAQKVYDVIRKGGIK